MVPSEADEATFVLHTSLSAEMLMHTKAVGDKKSSHTHIKLELKINQKNLLNL